VAALTKAPKKSGAGKLIGLGVVAVAALGVGYVLWQTFRADDELWVEEDA
jgi:type IV secretory pathway TrbF-like protein